MKRKVIGTAAVVAGPLCTILLPIVFSEDVPTMATGMEDYAPSETVIITGSLSSRS